MSCSCVTRASPAVMVIRILVLIALVVATAHGCWTVLYKEETLRIQMQKEIDRAIPVENIEFKFVESVVFGGSGGLGTTAIHFSSTEEFLNQVPPNEPIYFSSKIYVAPSGYKEMQEAKRTYLAFIEQRNGAMIFERNYLPSDDNWWLKKYSADEDALYLRKDNGNSSFFVTAIIVIIAVVAYFYLIDGRLIKLLSRPKEE